MIVLVITYIAMGPSTEGDTVSTDEIIQQSVPSVSIVKQVAEVPTHITSTNENESEEETPKAAEKVGGIDFDSLPLINNPTQEAPVKSPYDLEEYEELMTKDSFMDRTLDGAHRINKFSSLDKTFFSGNYQSRKQINGVETVFKLRLFSDENHNAVGCFGIHYDDDQKPTLGRTSDGTMTIIQTKVRHQIVVSAGSALLVLYRVWPPQKFERSHIMHHYKRFEDGLTRYYGRNLLFKFPKDGSLDEFCENPEIVEDH